MISRTIMNIYELRAISSRYFIHDRFNAKLKTNNSKARRFRKINPPEGNQTYACVGSRLHVQRIVNNVWT